MNKGYLKLCDFNHDTYRFYPDLKSMTDAHLEEHFLTYGINEGRVYSHIVSRKSFIDIIDKKGSMLEIGPLDNPQLDYRSPQYSSVDVFTKEELIRIYSKDPNVNKSKIIEPSYIIVNNDYSIIRERFDYIFSSHNIEHMPCLVTFLKNLAGVLKDNGYIYLVVPDKRYCFDYFKKETEIYDVLQLYFEKNYRPRLSDILKQVSQVTHNNASAHWDNDHGEVNLATDLTQQYENILNQFNTGVYIDSHVSKFTPQTFIEILTILKALKLINLEIHKIYHTLKGSQEFYVILKKI